MCLFVTAINRVKRWDAADRLAEELRDFEVFAMLHVLLTVLDPVTFLVLLFQRNAFKPHELPDAVEACKKSLQDRSSTSILDQKISSLVNDNGIAKKSVIVSGKPKVVLLQLTGFSENACSQVVLSGRSLAESIISGLEARFSVRRFGNT